MKLTQVIRALGWIQKNKPELAGCPASRVVLFGESYRLVAIHSRFEDVTFFVSDTSKLDDLGFPRVIRQSKDLSEALKGLVS